MGDLGNLEIDTDGNGQLSLVLADEHYAVADFSTWESLIGKAFVLHQDADDLSSNPSGASGERIGCGVINRIQGSQNAE